MAISRNDLDAFELILSAYRSAPDAKAAIVHRGEILYRKLEKILDRQVVKRAASEDDEWEAIAQECTRRAANRVSRLTPMKIACAFDEGSGA